MTSVLLIVAIVAVAAFFSSGVAHRALLRRRDPVTEYIERSMGQSGEDEVDWDLFERDVWALLHPEAVQRNQYVLQQEHRPVSPQHPQHAGWCRKHAGLGMSHKAMVLGGVIVNEAREQVGFPAELTPTLPDPGETEWR